MTDHPLPQYLVDLRGDDYRTIFMTAHSIYKNPDPIYIHEMDSNLRARRSLDHMRRYIIPRLETTGWKYETAQENNKIKIRAYDPDMDYATSPRHWTWSNSMFAVLRQCTQKFQYAYIDGLEPKTYNHAMARGTWTHMCLAADRTLQGLEKKTLLEIPAVLDPRIAGLDPLEVDDEALMLRHGVSEYELSSAGVMQFMQDQLGDYIEDEELNALLSDVESIIERYYLAHKDVHKEEPLLVEYEATRKHERTGITYHGTLDQVVRNAEGLIVIRDTKTHKRMPKPTVRLTNTQLNLYTWLINPLLMDHNLQPDSIEWDYIKTAMPSDAKITQAGKWSGSMGSTDAYTLRKTLPAVVAGMVADLEEKAADNEGKKRDNYLEKAKALQDPKVMESLLADVSDVTEPYSEWFFRKLQPINLHAVKTVLDENDRALSAYEGVGRQSYRSQNFMCDTCDFAQLCEAQMYGNDVTEMMALDFNKKDER